MKKLILIASGFSLGLVMVMMFAFSTTAQAQEKTEVKVKHKFAFYQCETGQIVSYCVTGHGMCTWAQYCP